MKKIFFVCSGAGRIKRGFEAHMEDLYRNIKSSGKWEVFFYKGGGTSGNNEIPITHFPRNSFIAKIFAFIAGRHPHDIQNISYFIGLIPSLIKNKAEIIYLGEPVICNLLIRWRKLSGQKFRIIFFTGGQTIPAKIGDKDIIHHVSPLCIKKAQDKGIPEEKQFLIPHFLNLSDSMSLISSEAKERLKAEYNIPQDSKIILSVGAIDSSVKRMDYLITEVSKLKEKVFLIMLGEEEAETGKIKAIAMKSLDKDSYMIKTVPRPDLHKYYSIADVFVLASLSEGFGMAYIEALAYGIPVIAHDYAVSRYVLKMLGYFTDLSVENNLAIAMGEILKTKFSLDQIQERYQFAYRNYSWKNLKPGYLNMFEES